MGQYLRWIGAALLAAGLAMVSSEPPIPFDGDGHVLFRKGAACGVKVELYLDLSCSDCAVAWPTMVQAANEFGRGAEFIFRIFPLPYHSNAFTAAKAAQVVRLYSDEDNSSVEAFVEQVFDEQVRILNAATADMTQSDIEDIFAGWATTTGGVTLEQFSSGMADSALDQKARYQFKYGCLHSIYGTPIVYVGGVFAESLSSGGASISTWRDVLEQVVPEATTTSRKYERKDGAVIITSWDSTEVAPCS